MLKGPGENTEYVIATDHMYAKSACRISMHEEVKKPTVADSYCVQY